MAEKRYSAECPAIEVREWRPGEPEHDLMGFDTKKDMLAHHYGGAGPFLRRVRPAEWRPPSLEAQITRAYLDGNIRRVEQTLLADENGRQN